MSDGEPIRVLVTLHQGGGSGAVNSTLHLALGLAARGLLVRFACPPDSPVEAEARRRGLEVHPIALAPRSRWSNASRLRDLLSNHPVDLINAQSSRDREAFTLLGVMGRLPAPLVLTRRSWPRTTAIENWFAGRVASRVIAVSEPVRAALEAGGIPRQRMSVVPNGVLTERLDRDVSGAELERWRQRIEWDGSRRTIGIVARPKDQPIVLHALAAVESPVRLVLSGLDPAALAEPLPAIPDRHAVVRLPFDPEVRPLYDLLEIVLHPSRWDALPQAVLEAMALGKPVIASRATGNEVIIRHEVDGLLAAPEDPSDWAVQLNRLLGDSSLAARLGQEARRRSRVDFSLEKTVDGTIAVYQGVLQGSPASSSSSPGRASQGTNAERGTRNSELLLAYDFPPRPGGIARALGEIARHAAPPMMVCTGRIPGDDQWDRLSGLRILRAPVDAERLRTVGGLIRWARAADRLVKASGTGFVWAGNIKPAGHIARWLRARRGIPFGLITHGLDLGILGEQAARSPRKLAVARSILGAAAGIVSNSEWTAERCRRLLRQLGLPHLEERIRVVLLGADPSRFTPEGPIFDLGPGSWLLTVSRLVPHKGIDTAIEALSRLAATRPHLRYAVAGGGPDRDRLALLAERLGLTDRVRFLGPVEETALPALYRAATLYLGLSREEGIEVEGFGLSLVEAQASGCAVVAAKSGGIPESVTDGRAGILVPPSDPQEAAQAIASLLDDDRRREELGVAGRQRVERQLNWTRVAEELSLAGRVFRGEARR